MIIRKGLTPAFEALGSRRSRPLCHFQYGSPFRFGRRKRVPQLQHRFFSSTSTCESVQYSTNSRFRLTLSVTPSTIELLNQRYPTDAWTNVTAPIAAKLPRRLHLQVNHPIALTRQLIASRFPSPIFQHYGDLPPVVTIAQNFDGLGFPADHPGRSRTDTYYVNATHCLRTHTSAHQIETFAAAASPGYTISSDVYRRDAIDRSHYPVFHQMEGARLWDRSTGEDGGDLVQTVRADLDCLRKHSLVVEDPNPTFHPERNPLQKTHSPEEVEALAAHLKRSLEDVVVTIFAAAEAAAAAGENTTSSASTEPRKEPLHIRWIEAYFPFTSPSWELEVWWNGEWLELLGCGIVQQDVLAKAGQPHKSGWAFGLGLERIAMLLYDIPDIRLFWSTDPRFLGQFREKEPPSRFVPFSRYPSCYKDVSFWLPAELASSDAAGTAVSGIATSASSFKYDTTYSPTKIVDPAGAGAAGGYLKEAASSSSPPSLPPSSPPLSPPPLSTPTTAPFSGTSSHPSSTTSASGPLSSLSSSSFHENDLMELIRERAGDLAEAVTLTDTFTHPHTGRTSRCYRIHYRSLTATLTNDEVNRVHEAVVRDLVERLGVEVR